MHVNSDRLYALTHLADRHCSESLSQLATVMRPSTNAYKHINTYYRRRVHQYEKSRRITKITHSSTRYTNFHIFAGISQAAMGLAYRAFSHRNFLLSKANFFTANAMRYDAMICALESWQLSQLSPHHRTTQNKNGKITTTEKPLSRISPVQYSPRRQSRWVLADCGRKDLWKGEFWARSALYNFYKKSQRFSSVVIKDLSLGREMSTVKSTTPISEPPPPPVIGDWWVLVGYFLISMYAYTV